MRETNDEEESDEEYHTDHDRKAGKGGDHLDGAVQDGLLPVHAYDGKTCHPISATGKGKKDEWDQGMTNVEKDRSGYVVPVVGKYWAPGDVATHLPTIQQARLSKAKEWATI